MCMNFAFSIRAILIIVFAVGFSRSESLNTENTALFISEPSTEASLSIGLSEDVAPLRLSDYVVEVSTKNMDNKSAAVTQTSLYTAFDDASWAIASTNLSTHAKNPRRQEIYDAFINECIEIDENCRSEDKARIFMNVNQPKSIQNYTKEGFKKIRAPPRLYKLLKDFWDQNKDSARVEYNDATAYHNSWQVPTTILMTEDSDLVGGGRNLSAAIWNSARDVLEEWTGQKLSGSSVYGIRVYHNQSILIPHVDRLPLVSSAIINVDQDVEEDWILEAYGHDGKATNVTMKPGDMVLYESATVIHGRPWPLQGSYYANIFVHFQPMNLDALLDEDPSRDENEGPARPPYLIKGSPWEKHFFHEFPNGWELLKDLAALIQLGDLYTLRHIIEKKPEPISESSTQCSLLVGAIRYNHLDIVSFFLEEMEFQVNMLCKTLLPLDVALYFSDPREPVVSYLLEKGARTRTDLVRHDHLDDYASIRESCVLFRRAAEHQNLPALEFLVDLYDVNVVCEGFQTPLDMAMLESYDESNEVISLLLENDAVNFEDLVDLVIGYDKEIDDDDDA